jgi:hypothetical protein
MELLMRYILEAFLEVFRFWLFLLLTFILEKYVWYKSCSSDFALFNKKTLTGLESGNMV